MLVDGDIRFAGESIVGLDPHRITRKGIARTFQTLRLFLNMSVRENVRTGLRGATDRDVETAFEELELTGLMRDPGDGAGFGGIPGAAATPRDSGPKPVVIRAV